jgi:hypothetical protein
MEITTLDNQTIKETDKFYSVVSKISNFLKIEPILFENEPELIKSVPLFRYEKNATLYSRFYNSALDNGFSIDEAYNSALEKIKCHFKDKRSN